MDIDILRSLKFSPHAIEQFKNRTGCTKSDKTIRSRLLKMMESGVEAELKPEFRVRQLINHNLQPATYIMTNNFIFVIIHSAVATIHKGEAKRWQVKAENGFKKV